MKQNSIFSYVKWNSNNSEGVDDNEQCSSNVKEAPDPKRTKCNSIAKIRQWDDTYFRRWFFLPDDQILNVAAKFQKCKKSESLSLLLFKFCNHCSFVELSDNEILDFLQVIRVFQVFVNGVPWQTLKYIRGSSMTKRLKSTVLQPFDFFVRGKTVHHYERSTFLKKTLYSCIFSSKPDNFY